MKGDQSAKEQQRLPENHQKWGERHGTDSPLQSTKGTSLLSSGSQTPSLQNCEIMNFLLFQPHHTWHFVMAVLAN